MLQILVLAATLVSTQAPPPEFKPSVNPVTDAARTSLGQQSKHLIDAAELMPADKYGYHPTDAQMSFAKLVAHVVQTNTLICSAIGNMPASPDVMKLADTAPKDTLVEALKQSVRAAKSPMTKTTNAGAKPPRKGTREAV